MADDEELLDDEEEEDELNWIAIIIATIVALALIGGLIWYFVLRDETADGPKEPDYVIPESLVEEKIYLDLPELFINPFDSRGRFFLILKFDVAYNDRALVFDEMILKPWNYAKAKNMIIDVYSEYTREELRTPKVKEETRQRLLDEFNTMLGWEYDAGLEELGQLEDPPIKALYYAKYILQ
jgi:flagellar basal body-associated protein FliL